MFLFSSCYSRFQIYNYYHIITILTVLLLLTASTFAQSKSLRFGDDGEEMVVAEDFSSLTSYTTEFWFRPDSTGSESNMLHFSGGQLRVQTSSGQAYIHLQKGLYNNPTKMDCV